VSTALLPESWARNVLQRLIGLTLANNPDDQVFNPAGTRYSARLVPRSRRMKSAAGLGNLAVSLIGHQSRIRTAPGPESSRDARSVLLIGAPRR
jgi:hypothetical protein